MSKYKPKREWISIYRGNLVALIPHPGGGVPGYYDDSSGAQYIYSHSVSTTAYLRHVYKLLLSGQLK